MSLTTRPDHLSERHRYSPLNSVISFPSQPCPSSTKRHWGASHQAGGGLDMTRLGLNSNDPINQLPTRDQSAACGHARVRRLFLFMDAAIKSPIADRPPVLLCSASFPPSIYQSCPAQTHPSFPPANPALLRTSSPPDSPSLLCSSWTTAGQSRSGQPNPPPPASSAALPSPPAPPNLFDPRHRQH